MGVASYNRGSRRIASDCKAQKSEHIRADLAALSDQLAEAEQRIAELERDLQRARRCLASERSGRESLRMRLQQSESNYAFAMSVLLPMAFRAEHAIQSNLL